ncbi:VCBS repeat-containing protein [Streptomyces sp. NPDC006482]|uniref:FG-GAP repeat domain-containing protein n=1 Tax=Streptomyces sp. NPDC006482 TaxID=3154306 RepID=UPI0033AE85E7
MHSRVPRTAVAVAVVLAAVSTLPAAAAPASVPVSAVVGGEQASDVVPFPRGAEVVGAGRTGFLTYLRDATTPGELRWTRYADGTSTVLPASSGSFSAGATGIVVTGDHVSDIKQSRVFTVHDMASGAAPLVVDTAELGEAGDTYTYRGAVGATLVFSVQKADGTGQGRLVAPGADGAEERVIGGLPADLRAFVMLSGSSHTAQLFVGAGPVDTSRYSDVVLDIPTGEITDTYPVTGISPYRTGAVSAGRVAWVAPESATSVVVGTRGTGDTRQFPIKAAGDRYGLVGNWLVSGPPTRPERESAVTPLTAWSLTEPGVGLPLLDRMSSLAPGPDGSLLARGGTVEHGEGLYRVTAGAEGEPVVELVASTGEPTALTYLGEDVPDVVDLDRQRSIGFRWNLSRTNVRFRLTFGLKGTTGTTVTLPDNDSALGPGAFDWTWHGEEPATPEKAAQPGEYAWRIEAVPRDGIGDTVRASGTVTVRRTPGAHDYDGDGEPEIFGREANGRLYVVSTFYRPGAVSWGTARVYLGSGWNTYDRLESAGDVAGTRFADTLARDKSGVLWLYQGSGEWTRSLLSRVRIGGGWQTYDRLAGGSDLTGDGRADLVATDKTGAMYLYKGTGKASAPFATRRKTGAGWGIYNDITAVGNVAGAPAGDLVARDKAGVLWLYLGKGDGTFAQRLRIGGGWNAYDGLIGAGDVNRDGRPDLLVRTGTLKLFYPGTGDWRAPFNAGGKEYVLTEEPSYNEVF